MLLASRWAIFSATTAGIIAYSPSGLLSTAAGNRQTAVNQLGLGGLVDHDFLIRLLSVKLKPISPRATVMRFISISCFTGFILFRQHRLLLLLAKLFITLQLGFLFSSTASRASRA